MPYFTYTEKWLCNMIVMTLIQSFNTSSKGTDGFIILQCWSHLSEIQYLNDYILLIIHGNNNNNPLKKSLETLLFYIVLQK